jgi:CxxC-x17-CxxC domain-containing protein
MKSYNRNSRSGGRKYGGGDFRRRDSGPREMYKAVCDQCGKDCEVPFKPTKDKPIYCSDCFESRGGSGSKKRDSGNKEILQELNSLNAKLDRILIVLEPKVKKKPVSPKPTSEDEVTEQILKA